MAAANRHHVFLRSFLFTLSLFLLLLVPASAVSDGLSGLTMNMTPPSLEKPVQRLKHFTTSRINDFKHAILLPFCKFQARPLDSMTCWVPTAAVGGAFLGIVMFLLRIRFWVRAGDDEEGIPDSIEKGTVISVPHQANFRVLSCETISCFACRP